MGEDLFKEAIKASFQKAKEDISRINQELALQKEVLSHQNEVLRILNNKLNATLQKMDEIDSKIANFSLSVNQSITNQSLINHLITSEKEAFKEPIDNKKGISIGNEGVNQSFNHIINQQSITNQSFKGPDPNFQALKDTLEGTFRVLSKQELKVFLTVYQLEDDGKQANYTNIAQILELSEHCIRSHVSSLLKKNAPLIKRKLNNKRNLLSLRKDFKALNLKQRLINMYYEADPYQTTLFDIK